MPDAVDGLKFHALQLREEVKAAEAKVSAAIAASAIILSANFLMLRGNVGWFAALAGVVAAAAALGALLAAIWVILPRDGKGKTVFYFGTNMTLEAEAIAARLATPDRMEAELALLCKELAAIAARKYRMVRRALTFLMTAATLTAMAVLLRFLGDGPGGIDTL